MSVDEIKLVLLLCLLVSYSFLIFWWLAFMLAHDWIYRLHGRWFKFPVETFDAIHYAGMAAYKIGVLLLVVVPLIALHLVY